MREKQREKDREKIRNKNYGARQQVKRARQVTEKEKKKLTP